MTDTMTILKVGPARRTRDIADATKLVHRLEDPSILEKPATLPIQPCNDPSMRALRLRSRLVERHQAPS